MTHTHFRPSLAAIASGLALVASCAGATKEYSLTIAKQEIEIAGGSRPAMTINGGVPGPVLRFVEGDDAVLHVTNSMDVPTSIHWHGLLVPPAMDGVPFISFPPIAPGTSYTYRFPIRQAGTYWYHSHTELQEQSGVYGSIVILPKKIARPTTHDQVAMLSDWTNDDPKKVLHYLRRGSEYFGVKKKTAQSFLGAVKTDKAGEWFKREAMRMPAMDIADVAYDAFLINGEQASSIDARPGDTVRLRVIDGSATSFFHLQYAGGPMKIIEADGQPVETVTMEEPLLIGVAETYDVIVKVPASGSYEFRATAHDASGYASLWIGSGDKHPVEAIPAPFVYDTMDMFGWTKLFAITPAGSMGMPTRHVRHGMFDQPGMNMDMTHSMEMTQGAMAGMDDESMNHGSMPSMNQEEMGHGGMKMGDNALKRNHPTWYDFLLKEDASSALVMASDSMMSKNRPFAPYKKLRALRNTAFSPDAPRREVRLTLDGDMERYVWFLNNQPLAPENDIKIAQGEVVRFIMINRTMMHHPMHLHGHFFRVINGQGDRSPLKHTVDVEPMSTTVIEFDANEVGDWFFHCHLLYHMKGGMARVVRYDGYDADPATAAVAHKRYEDHVYLFGQSDVLSNMSQGYIMLQNLRNDLSLSWEAGWQEVDGTTWESELTYSRYLNRFTSVFAGAYLEGIDGVREDARPIAGIAYTLPGNFHSAAWVDHEGEARLTIEREIMLTPRLGIFGEVEYDTIENWAYQGGVSYTINRNLAATALWDSNYGVGAGFTIKF